MDEEVITISGSSNSSSGCSSADLRDSDGIHSKDTQGAEVNKSQSSDPNTGSITTEPLRDSDAGCDWEIYETWTILGEPVMKPIILGPSSSSPSSTVVSSVPPQIVAPIQEQPKAGQMVKPFIKKESDITVSTIFADVIEEDDQCVIVSDNLCTVQKAANVLNLNNTLMIPNDVGCRSDCETPSDGISVISDCSDCAHHHRHSPLTIDTSAPTPTNVENIPRNFDTPPNTPERESSTPLFKLRSALTERDGSSDKFSLESRSSRSFDVVSPANIILFSLLAGITGIVLGNAFRVRSDDDGSILNHISPLVLRIQDLERENSDLKSQLKKLKSSGEGSATSSQNVEMIFPQPLEFYLEQNINENGKRVWTGDQDNEEPITLVNSRFRMPEFCNEDKADDLFSDRYQKICDEKVRKLSKTVQNARHQNNNCDTASSTCSECKSRCASSATKQSDVEANFADDDESSVDRVKVEKEKSPHIKRKLKRQKPVKDDNSDSSSDATLVNNDYDKVYSNSCKKGPCSAGIFDKRKTAKKNSNEDKENKKARKVSVDWNEKRKTGRDEMRRTNGVASSGNEDWFTKRASNREKQRGNVFDKKK